MANSNFLKRLKEECGISLSWLAAQLDMSRQAFQYACKRGFSESEVSALEDALARSGRRLVRTRVPQELRCRKTKVAEELRYRKAAEKPE